jgi:hypothetical protein
MPHIGFPEFLVGAAALLFAFFGWLIFRPNGEHR